MSSPFCQTSLKKNQATGNVLSALRALQNTTDSFCRFQGCALAASGCLRRLTFDLGQLKKKSGRPSGCLDFGLCENPKRIEQTYWNGTERNKKNFLMLPRSPLTRKKKAQIAQYNSKGCSCTKLSCLCYIICSTWVSTKNYFVLAREKLHDSCTSMC